MLIAHRGTGRGPWEERVFGPIVIPVCGRTAGCASSAAYARDMEQERVIREYDGKGIVVTWEPARCQHAAECVRGLPQVFDRDARPWIDASRASAGKIVEVIDRCPSFALGYRTSDGRTRTAPDA